MVKGTCKLKQNTKSPMSTLTLGLAVKLKLGESYNGILGKNLLNFDLRRLKSKIRPIVILEKL